VDNRRFYYLLTLLPPLPPLGGALPMTMAEALARLRQQGEGDLGILADALEAEQSLRESLDEWVANPPGSRTVPAALPPPLASLFDETSIAETSADAWVGSVWQAYLDLLAGVGRSIGSSLLPRWSAWEASLRRRLARLRSGLREDRPFLGREAGEDDGFRQDAILAEWTAARERGGAGMGLTAAMEAEEILDGRRLDFLDEESPRYAFTVDELVAFFLKLRLLERRQRLDPGKGRALLRQAAAP